MPKIGFSILILIGIFSTSASASPTINVVSGTFTNDTSVIISGANFGTKSQAAPLTWDTFNSGTVGNTVQNVTLGTNWSSTGVTGGTCPKYSNTVLRTNDTMSAKINIVAPAYNCSFGWNGAESRYWYISYWRYDIQPESSHNYKHFRIYASNDSMEYWYTELDGGSAVYGVSDAAGQTAGLMVWTGQGPKSQWIREEFYVDTGTRGSSNGSAKRWLNAELIDNLSFTAPALINGYSGMLNMPRIGHFYSTDTPQGLTSYFSEAYIDNTQARVEIGNASSWNSCTHREIQIPSAWSTGSITIKVNKGSFADGNTAYLYVVDSNGNVNAQGYPIVVGGGTPSPSPPSTPSGLKIIN